MAVDTYFILLLVSECLLYTFHLSILLLLIVKRKNKFEGAFYNIFRITLVADFLTFVYSIIILKISLIQFFVDFYKSCLIFASFMTALSPFLLFIQFLGRFLMAFNRFTLIWFPLSYQKFWKGQWYTVVMIILPFLPVCWRLHVSVKYTFLSDGTILSVYEEKYVQPIIKALTAIICFTITVAAGTINGLSLIKFYYNKRKSINYRLNQQNLFYMSIIIFIAQFCRTCYPISQYLFPTNENVIAFFAAAYSLLNDILALSGSISFFLLSKTARKEYIAFYFKYTIVVSNISQFVTVIKPSGS